MTGAKLGLARQAGTAPPAATSLHELGSGGLNGSPPANGAVSSLQYGRESGGLPELNGSRSVNGAIASGSISAKLQIGALASPAQSCRMKAFEPSP